jgi:hypothetical protein
MKCKSKTDTVGEKKVRMPNGRNAIKGKCKVCGTNKTQFVAGKSQKGGMFGREQKTEYGDIPMIPERKTKFKLQPIKRMVGEGWFNDYVMPRLPELHYVSPFTGKRHSFTGPGTKLNKRIDPKTKKPLPHSQPVNEVDKTAYLHDLAYDEFPDLERRKIADNVMIEDLNQIRKDKKLDWKTRADALLVGGVMKLKRMLGLGKKKRKQRK